MQQVTASLRATGTYGSDQGAVWASIERKMSRLGAKSDTRAMAAMYEDQQQPIEDFVSAFRVMDGQVGAMFLVNGRPGGIELFDATATWRKLSSKLIRSYALDAIDRSKEPTMPAAPFQGSDLIAAIRSSQAAVFTAVGEGDDVRLTGTGIAAAALVARGRAIHLSAFATK